MAKNKLYSEFIKSKISLHIIILFAILVVFLLLLYLFRKDKYMTTFFVCLCLLVIFVWICLTIPFIMDSIDDMSYIVYSGEYNITEIVYAKNNVYIIVELTDKTTLKLNITEYQKDFQTGCYNGLLEYSKYSKYLLNITLTKSGDG